MCAAVNPERNAIFQYAFQSRCKLIVMYLIGLSPAIPGYALFPALSPVRGEFDLFLGWCLSAEGSGLIPVRGKDKRVGEDHIRGFKLGKWVEELNLYNLCRMWEMHLANRPFTPVDVAEWFLDPSLLKSMKKYGLRLLAGVNRVGGDEDVVGSFLWVMKTGMELLDDRETSQLLPQDTNDLVQWWFHSALAEAGRLFASEVKRDTDYSKPLRDVFLLDSADGCIAELKSKRLARDKWGSMVDELPFTIGAVMSQATLSSPASNVTQPDPSAMSRLQNSVLSVSVVGKTSKRDALAPTV